MPVFLDTGVLLRAVHRADPFYHDVRLAVRSLIQDDSPLLTGLQQFAEFWNISTRPAGERGGFALSVEEAARRLQRIERGVKLLTELPRTPDVWKELVQKYHVRGVQVHDARIVALMITHSVSRLLTLNKADFHRYEPEGIVPVTPADVVASL